MGNVGVLCVVGLHEDVLPGVGQTVGSAVGRVETPVAVGVGAVPGVVPGVGLGVVPGVVPGVGLGVVPGVGGCVGCGVGEGTVVGVGVGGVVGVGEGVAVGATLQLHESDAGVA